MQGLGKLGEQLVEEQYRREGYKILERNYIFPHGKQMGELDLVVTKDRQLVFIEVKTRSSIKFGDGLEALNQNKQRKLVKMAKLYFALHSQFRDYDCRIDVALVLVDHLDSDSRSTSSKAETVDPFDSRSRSTSSEAEMVDKPIGNVIIVPNAIEDLD